MRYLRPTTWPEALAAKAAHPRAVAVCGGTDVMVELNDGRRRPEALLDLGRVAELAEWGSVDGRLRVGAAVSYSRIVDELSSVLPGLSTAAMTVGSPQIRNRGTVGGNLGTASPAGDCHPPLLAAGATVEVASVRGVREIPAEAFYLGVKRTALAPDELIAAVLVEPPTGPEQFAKVGVRGGMVIAVCSVAVALRPGEGVGVGIGSVAATPRRAERAERFLAAELDAGGHWRSGRPLPDSTLDTAAELVAAAAEPVDDVRGSARYRRHALGVLARRTLSWAWADYRGREA